MLRLVDIKPGGMIGADHEVVLAGVVGEDRAGPAHRKCMRVHFARHGRIGAEIERRSRIDPLQRQFAETAIVVIASLQPAIFAPSLGTATENAKKIGQRLAILIDCQPGQFDPRADFALEPSANNRNRRRTSSPIQHTASLVCRGRPLASFSKSNRAIGFRNGCRPTVRDASQSLRHELP